MRMALCGGSKCFLSTLLLACLAGVTALSCGAPEVEFQTQDEEGGAGPDKAGGNTGTPQGVSPSSTPTALACLKDEDCSDYESTRICDPVSRSCVECLPTETTCGHGLYCATAGLCAIGCANAEDCGRALTCEGHRCRGCSTDDQCPPGTQCDSSDSPASCGPGCSDERPCPEGWACCAGRCANLLSDPEHCGDCEQSCESHDGAVRCANGSCLREGCEEGSADCNEDPGDGCEVDTAADRDNCGACGRRCEDDDICNNGRCGLANCPDLTADCDEDDANGCETDLRGNLENCGGCGKVCALEHADATCSAGACEIASCSGEHADCDGDAANGCETNTASDADHCGVCRHACSTEHGSPRCEQGVCALDCDEDWGDCDGDPDNGCESGLLEDEQNCGECRHPCTNPNGDTRCEQGECSPECGAGYLDCDGLAGNGCETDIGSSPEHCGACGAACNLIHAAALCLGGECAISHCDEDWADCDGDPETGCEVGTTNDPEHCGGCHRPCSSHHGAPACAAGTCEIECASGYADCNQDSALGPLSDGCEADLSRSVLHCGACGEACDAASDATPNCSAEGCGATVCPPEMANCDGDLANGCEVNLATNLESCDRCGVGCPTVPHATSACEARTCTIAECDAETDDCDENYENGCETDLASDAANCGSCGRACDLPQTEDHACIERQCRPQLCASGYLDCDGEPQNGCETNIAVPEACGGCGRACSLAHSDVHACVDGSCEVVTCDPGWGDCDGNPGNGCETSLVGNTEHCGACRNLCASANAVGTCTGAEGTACEYACSSLDRANCNGDWSDGCEVDLEELTSCRSCSSDCTALPHVGAVSCLPSGCRVESCSDAAWGDCTEAAGCETDLRVTPAHCGGCGEDCSLLPHVATTSCAGGQCVIDTCLPPFADCDEDPANGCETNTDVNDGHCGECRHNCFGNEVESASCVAGECIVYACSEGFDDCSESPGCETVSVDNPEHCGRCDRACTVDASKHMTSADCEGSACRVTGCSGSYQDCDGNYSNGCETDTSVNVLHCGACTGATAVCPTAAGTPRCEDGECRYSVCAFPLADCVTEGTCEIDLVTDKDHCGQCAMDCDSPNPDHTVASTCVAGECSATACEPGWEDCNGDYADGCEVDTSSDPDHCGTCGARCRDEVEVVNAASYECVAGLCRAAQCVPGFGDCDDSAANGCETTLEGNEAHCGVCDNACGDPANAASVCNGTTCEYTCNTGFRSCGGGIHPGDGCETDTTGDPYNCGGCDQACALDHTVAHACVASTCRIETCAPGWDDCNDIPGDGCEAGVTSPAACGACNAACNLAHASASCAYAEGEYACAVTECSSNDYADCDGVDSNGCEVHLATDPDDCGECGIACEFSHAVAQCSLGSCVLGPCLPDYANCNVTSTDGCEADLRNDAAHCGECGTECVTPNGTTQCLEGACEADCADGWAACGDPSAGCTTGVGEDEENCGTCGTVCGGTRANATPACASGVCGFACQGSWKDCDEDLTANGCEVDTSISTPHCGACGQDCAREAPPHTTPACSASSCVYTCAEGWGNCDANMASNGCETEVYGSDPTHCGQCNRGCEGLAPYCVEGECVPPPDIECDGNGQAAVYTEARNHAQESWTHVLRYGPGEDRIVLVGISCNGTDEPITASYGGAPLTLLASRENHELKVYLYYLLEAQLTELEAGSSNEVSVQMSSSQVWDAFSVALACRNVAQAAPSVLTTAITGTSVSDSATVGVSGSWLYSQVAWQMGNATPGSDLVEISSPPVDNLAAGAATKPCVGTPDFSCTASWSGLGNFGAHVVALLQPGVPH